VRLLALPAMCHTSSIHQQQLASHAVKTVLHVVQTVAPNVLSDIFIIQHNKHAFLQSKIAHHTPQKESAAIAK